MNNPGDLIVRWKCSDCGNDHIGFIFADEIKSRDFHNRKTNDPAKVYFIQRKCSSCSHYDYIFLD